MEERQFCTSQGVWKIGPSNPTHLDKQPAILIGWWRSPRVEGNVSVWGRSILERGTSGAEAPGKVLIQPWRKRSGERQRTSSWSVGLAIWST